MTDYKDIDSTEKNIMESMGYHWNGHGWQRALNGGSDDMIVEGWVGGPPKNPSQTTRIWDQKIGEMNKTPLNENEDFIEPMPEGLKNIYRKESDDKIKYASALEADLSKQIQQIDKDIANLQNQIKQLSLNISDSELSKMQLSLSKLSYQRAKAKLLHTEATKRRTHEQYIKYNHEHWFLSLEKPTGTVRNQKKEISKKQRELLTQEKQLEAQIEQDNKVLASAQNDINQKQKTLESELKKEEQSIKDALKLTSDFYKELFEKYGANSSNIAKELAAASKGKQIRSVDEALRAYDKFRNSLNKKYSLKDRQAITHALESINRAEIAKNFGLFSKAFGFVSKTVDRYDLAVELKKSIETDNWRPFFLKMESLAAGRAASAITAWTFAVMLGTPVGVLGYAIIMAAMSALVNDSFIEKINKLAGV